MRKPFTNFIPIAFACAVTLTAIASQPLQKEDSEAAPGKARTEAAPLTPMMQEIKDAFAAAQDELDRLQPRLAAAPDEQAYLSVLREMEQIKLGTEVRILEIQAEYARSEGRTEQAQEIETAIEALRSLRGPHAEVHEPAPESAEN